MITSVAIINRHHAEDFSVADDTGALQDSVPLGEFSFHLFDPDDLEVSGSISYTFDNLGDGHYRFNFTPNKAGTWYLAVYHPTHFATGKYGTVIVYLSDALNHGAIGELNKEFVEDFSVVNLSGALKDDLNLGELTYDLYDPYDNEVGGTVTVSFTKLGHGHYRARYTPDEEGNWYLVVYHPTYFHYGKASSVDVFSPVTIEADGGPYGVDGHGQPFDFARERVRRKRLVLRKISNNDKKPSLRAELK